MAQLTAEEYAVLVSMAQREVATLNVILTKLAPPELKQQLAAQPVPPAEPAPESGPPDERELQAHFGTNIPPAPEPARRAARRK